VTLNKTIARAQRDDYIETIYWFLLNAFGGLMPVWGSFFLLKLFSINPNFSEVITNGELVLFSGSLLSSGLYVINKKSKLLARFKSLVLSKDAAWEQSFPGSRFFTVFSFIIMGITILVFSGVVIARVPDSHLYLDIGLLSFSTISIFIISMITGLLITFYESTWGDPFDSNEISENQIKKLGVQVKKIRKGQR